jgi:tol-pal system protein YbgF
MNRAMLRWSVILLLLPLSACVGFGQKVGEDGLTEEERRLRTIESRVSELNRRLDNIIEAQTQQGGPMAMANELRSLRGEVEQMRFEMERNEQRNQRLYQDLDRRLQSGGGGTGGLAGSATVAVQAEASPEEEKAYLEAFDLLKNGRYDDAILGFEHVLKNWPEGAYAANALYWSGESHYVKRDYQKALDNFLKLIEQFPDSTRTPDAMLKAGFAYEEQRKTAEARRMLQRLVNEHGDSSAANLARQRLERMAAR